MTDISSLTSQTTALLRCGIISEQEEKAKFTHLPNDKTRAQSCQVSHPYSNNRSSSPNCRHLHRLISFLASYFAKFNAQIGDKLAKNTSNIYQFQQFRSIWRKTYRITMSGTRASWDLWCHGLVIAYIWGIVGLFKISPVLPQFRKRYIFRKRNLDRYRSNR